MGAVSKVESQRARMRHRARRLVDDAAARSARGAEAGRDDRRASGAGHRPGATDERSKAGVAIQRHDALAIAELAAVRSLAQIAIVVDLAFGERRLPDVDDRALTAHAARHEVLSGGR